MPISNTTQDMAKFLQMSDITPPSSPAYPVFTENSSIGSIRSKMSGVPDTVCVAIVGCGFVGEALLKEFGHVYNTIGFDISPQRIQDLTRILAHFQNVELTTDETMLSQATHYLIAVPTLLRDDRSVNLDFVLAALRTILKYARPGSCIVIESSVSVGTTRELLAPYKDMHCGMSPERVDPGRTFPTASQIPKIISGLTPAAIKAISTVYSEVFDTVVPVSKPEVAEMTKLFENCYRMVNIAYVNEMSDACRSHGIDPDEMIKAASTKPYGYQPFSPGLGVGGHCIPVNPFYLFATNKNLPILAKSTTLMWNRPKKLANKLHQRCLRFNKTQQSNGHSPRILVVGVGFKPGQSVLSCSPGLSFAQTLNDLGCARLSYYDPLVAQTAVSWMEKLGHDRWTSDYIESNFDAVAICVRQSGVDFSIVENLKNVHVRSYSS